MRPRNKTHSQHDSRRTRPVLAKSLIQSLFSFARSILILCLYWCRATHAESLTFYTLHASSVHVAAAHTHRHRIGTVRWLFASFFYIFFLLAFMWCHERIKKISHCSGPIHKYINTYEIFIFLRAADSNLHIVVVVLVFLLHCYSIHTIHNSPSGYKNTETSEDERKKRKKKLKPTGQRTAAFRYFPTNKKFNKP